MKLAKRIRIRFSLRALLLLSTVFALYLGYVSYQARNQQQAVASIEALGGTVYYDFQLDNRDFEIADAKVPGPLWLRRIIGEHYFQTVVTDDLNSTKTADSDLEHLSKLPRIRYLRLAHSKVTDAGMKTVRELSHLESLDLSRTALTDRGLLELATLPSLRVIMISGTKVTAEGVAEFRSAAPNCEVVLNEAWKTMDLQP